MKCCNNRDKLVQENEKLKNASLSKICIMRIVTLPFCHVDIW